MRVLITGANGQLGNDLCREFAEGHCLFSFKREELDVADDRAVRDTVQRIRPDVVLQAAAYTNVDKAESEVDAAFRVNAIGARNTAVAAEEVGAKFVYVSTDYVFDGRTRRPYTEFDQTNPLSVYGRSKLAGEDLSRSLCRRHFVVRTSWLYGAHGQNFVKKVINLARTRDYLTVVTDQVGSPTYSVDLASFIGQLILTERYGTYHATNTGSCSWHEFATAALAGAGLSHVRVEPLTSDQLIQAAPRPANSVLDPMMIRLNGFHELRHWRAALDEFLASATEI